MRTIISMSGKKKNNRSKLLSALMKQLGGDTGNELADAFCGKSPDAFRDKLNALTSKMVSKMPNVSG